jgi:3-deoxy-D-manno-octulosonic-acid transferase
MSFLYLEIYRILYPLCLFLAKMLSFSSYKLKKGLRMREDRNRVPPWLNFTNIEQPILIHCASGEFEYAKPVIREIKKRNPQQAVVDTYFSPT